MPTHPSKRKPVEKVPYVATQRVKADMADSQKRGIETWNMMVQALKNNGLMEDKPE